MQNFKNTLAETKTFLGLTRHTIKSNPLYFEYVSKYRRITVIGEGNGYELHVHYKGIEVKDWAKRYGCKDIAIYWAVAASENREIIIGCLTIKEAPGKRNI